MAQTQKQPLAARLGFFVLGGLGSNTLNYSILQGSRYLLHWPKEYGLALSTVATAMVFFLWSYYINFRTSRMWHQCLGRYLTCLVLAACLSYLLGLLGLNHFKSNWWLTTYAVLFCVQSFTGGIKFLLYHFWVFPPDEAPPAESAASSSAAL